MRYPVFLKSLIIAAMGFNTICQISSSFYIRSIDEKYFCKGEPVYISIGIWVNCIGCSNHFPEINVINGFVKPYGIWINKLIDKFDLTDPDELSKCFHYSNTQPLHWKDNREKSNKF